jgi:hypothetical protein
LELVPEPEPVPKAELEFFFNSKIGTVFLVLFMCGTKTGIELFGELYLEKITTIIRVNCWMQFKLPRTGLEKLKWIFKILF